MMITRNESIWTDLASLAVAGASRSRSSAFVLTSVLAALRAPGKLQVTR